MNLVFDIGSNTGYTVEHFRQRAKAVIAFEPNPELANDLRRRFQGTNVTVDERGLSNECGRKIFHLCNAHTISTFSTDWISGSRFTGTYNWDRSIEVETITLEKALSIYGEPDYIKIDVEGYEYEVLSSFNQLLENTIISFEWAEEQKDKIQATLEHVQKIGYNSFSFTDGDIIKHEGEINWVNFSDFIFLENMIPSRKKNWGMCYFKK